MRWWGKIQSAGPSRHRLTLAIAVLAVAFAPAAASAARQPTNDEIALLVLANQARSNPSADGGTETVVPPMFWNDDLTAAAQFHSDDMAANGCYQHNSCNGQSWSKRITKFYPNWEWIGENIGSGTSDPRYLHLGWMLSPGHRANILSGAYNDFGAAMAMGQDGFGTFPLATEDFGRQALIALELMPTLPAGCVLPRQGTASQTRELLVNYYHYNGGPPQSVHAIVGSSCVNMTLVQGSATHGTYRAAKALSGSGCVPAVFEAIRSDGTVHRWPEHDAVVIGIGTSNCPERTSNLPTRDCGGGSPPAPEPTPTPAPAPTPVPGTSGSVISGARIVLKPGPANASKGRVNLNATFTPPADFDPTAGDLVIQVQYGSNGEWRQALPQLCDSQPCLSANRRGTVFSGRFGTNGPSIRFNRRKNGEWTVRLAAMHQTLSAVAPGSVTLEVALAGMAATADLMGEVHGQSLTAK
jgi:uncharacterized protein YkwD